MLSYKELLGQVKYLTPEERLALIEATTQMLKEDLRHQVVTNVDKATTNEYVPFVREDWLHLDEEMLKAKGIELRGTPVESVLGIGWAVEDGPPQPMKITKRIISTIFDYTFASCFFASAIFR